MREQSSLFFYHPFHFLPPYVTSETSVPNAGYKDHHMRRLEKLGKEYNFLDLKQSMSSSELLQTLSNPFARCPAHLRVSLWPRP